MDEQTAHQTDAKPSLYLQGNRLARLWQAGMHGRQAGRRAAAAVFCAGLKCTGIVDPLTRSVVSIVGVSKYSGRALRSRRPRGRACERASKGLH